MCSCGVWAQGFALELARTFQTSFAFSLLRLRLLPLRLLRLRLLRFLVMAVVAKAVAQDQRVRLAQICATWRNGDLTEQGTQIITMADEALDILREVGWVTQRVLPNSAVDAL